jgi:hypothetical protein
MIQTVEADAIPGEAALLAEAALVVDLLRPEEDAAWSHLQQASSFKSPVSAPGLAGDRSRRKQ